MHRAAEHGTLPDDAWRLIESRLPWVEYWFRWDRCQRLRASVIDLFVERNLQPDLFGRLVEDSYLFNTLAKAASKTGRGRTYLERVESSMRDSDSATRDRVLALEKLLS